MIRLKTPVRLLCLLLALLCVFALASCNLDGILPPGLLGADSGNNPASSGGDDGSFTPENIEEITKSVYETSYRDQLNDNEKAIYDAVSSAEAGVHVFTVSLPDALSLCKGREPSESEKNDASARISFWITNALYAVWLDCPRLFWMETGNYEYAYSMVPTSDGIYHITEVKITTEARENAQNAALYLQEIDALLSSLSLQGANDYETVWAINNYLCERIDYVDAEDRQNIYGALIKQKCVCEGYAHAFKLLCDKYGIVCATIIGTGYSNGESEGHMWNAVKMDGAWYAVDVTWNDQKDKAAQNGFVLIGSATEKFGERFDRSHVPDYTRGASKVFACPKLSLTAYTQEP